eukprot:gene19184-25030_t
MKIELFLVRHGETTANRDNILQGHSDFPLTDRGQEEASKVGEVFSNFKWSRAYTSDLNRAIKTSIIVFSKSSQELPLNTDSLLREINFGVLEGLPRNTKLEEAKIIISKRDGIPIEDIDDISESRDDPEHGVGIDDAMDPQDVSVPYLRDNVRMEIYNKYKEDSNIWTFKKLSETYKCSEIRIKAVIQLMKIREDMIKENSISTAPEQLVEIISKTTESKDLTTLSAEYNMSTDELNEIIRKDKINKENEDDLNAINEYYEEVMAEFQELGADTNFREIPAKAKKQVRDDYFPELFGDEDFLKQKLDLFRRIENETKSILRPHPGLVNLRKLFDKNVETDEPIVTKEEFNDSASTEYTDTNQVVSTTESNDNGDVRLSRFKYALRDTSKPLDQRETVIRTRSGKLRPPTPVEELNRSWVRKPQNIDLQYYSSRFEKYKDPDGDEEKVKQQILNKTLKRRELKAKK